MWRDAQQALVVFLDIHKDKPNTYEIWGQAERLDDSFGQLLLGDLRAINDAKWGWSLLADLDENVPLICPKCEWRITDNMPDRRCSLCGTSMTYDVPSA